MLSKIQNPVGMPSAPLTSGLPSRPRCHTLIRFCSDLNSSDSSSCYETPEVWVSSPWVHTSALWFRTHGLRSSTLCHLWPLLRIYDFTIQDLQPVCSFLWSVLTPCLEPWVSLALAGKLMDSAPLYGLVSPSTSYYFKWTTPSSLTAAWLFHSI